MRLPFDAGCGGRDSKTGACAGPDVWGGVSPVSGVPFMTGVLEPPSGNGGFPDGGPPSMTGVLESPKCKGCS